MTTYLRDITRRKLAKERLEAERARLQAIITYSPVGILLVEGEDGHRVTANHKAEELLGRPIAPEGGIAQFLGRICSPSGQPWPPAGLPSIRALHGETVVAEDTVILGYADLLRHSIQRNRTREAGQSLEHLIVSSRRLDKMVEDLLHVSRIESRVPGPRFALAVGTEMGYNNFVTDTTESAHVAQ